MPQAIVIPQKRISYSDNTVNLNDVIIYYRIAEVDKDGRTALSQIRTVKKSSQDLFTVFPNPAKGIINLSGINMRRVQIFDITGKIILFKKLPGANLSTVNVSNLSKGTYIIEVKNLRGDSEKRKLLIE